MTQQRLNHSRTPTWSNPLDTVFQVSVCWKLIVFFCSKCYCFKSKKKNLMIMSVHKEKTDLLDINQLGNAFVQGNDHRLQQFGHF